MRYILLSCSLWVLASCSSPPDGLWIETNENSLLKFYGDSVLNNSLQTNVFRASLGFRITKDSIAWTGLNPDWNNGKKENSFKYVLSGDTLQIWFRPNERFVFHRSQADSYLDHFLAKGNLEVKLPVAVNAMPTFKRYFPLNLRIGVKDKKVKIFIDGNETHLYELDNAIKSFKAQADFIAGPEPNFICQLFIDENVPCDYTFSVFESLRANDIRTVNFIASTSKYDPYTADFWGMKYTIPPIKLNLIEEPSQQQHTLQN